MSMWRCCAGRRSRARRRCCRWMAEASMPWRRSARGMSDEADEMRGVLLEPTEEQRRIVRALAGFGVVHDNIAKHIGCEPKTLRKHFREELDRGSVEATAKV